MATFPRPQHAKEGWFRWGRGFKGSGSGHVKVPKQGTLGTDQPRLLALLIATVIDVMICVLGLRIIIRLLFEGSISVYGDSCPPVVHRAR